MTKFAKGTEVPVEKSKAEIEATVRRYGATGFMGGWEDDRAFVEFKCQNRHIRFRMTLPDANDRKFKQHSRGWRTPEAATKEWEQACRQKWRALCLLVKAKLEAVESNIGTFEQEFLAHIVLPNGKTVGEEVIPKVAIAYEQRSMTPLLEGPRE